MKTFKILCVVLLVISFSCNNDDDDSPAIERGAFPKKIVKTSTIDPTANRSFNFTYNNDNQIAEISIVYPEGEVYQTYELSYNNNLLTKIDTETITYLFDYTTDNILSSITLALGTKSLVVPVNYNETAHSYTLTVEGEITMTMTPDESFPLMYESFVNTIIGYTSIDGVFSDVAPQVGLQLFFSGFAGMDYFFFHPYQIQAIIHNDLEWTYTNTRDADNNIVTVNTTNTFETLNYTIEYEKREL